MKGASPITGAESPVVFSQSFTVLSGLGLHAADTLMRIQTLWCHMIARRTHLRVLVCTVSTTLLLLVASPVAAQETSAAVRANAAYFELLGNGGLFSVNYERALMPALRVRIGAASWTAESFWSDAETRIRTFPMMLHVVPGGGAHHLEAAIGLLPGHRGRDVGESGAFMTLIGLIGYRYEPPARRFIFRAGVTPFYGFGDPATAYPDPGFLPSLGLSFGARF